jgi:hypothetical protein
MAPPTPPSARARATTPFAAFITVVADALPPAWTVSPAPLPPPRA